MTVDEKPRFRVITGQSRVPRAIRDTWPTSVPWQFVEGFRERAESSHGQTLEQLNSRGGLGPDELWRAAHDRKLFTKDVPSEEECGQWLIDTMKRLEGVKTDGASELAAWSAFAARITLTFPFRVDVIVRVAERHPDRAEMGVELHVPDRDTREPITVLTRRPCPVWTNDEDAAFMLFDLLTVALAHETHESVRLDGKLVRELHKATL